MPDPIFAFQEGENQEYFSPPGGDTGAHDHPIIPFIE